MDRVLAVVKTVRSFSARPQGRMAAVTTGTGSSLSGRDEHAPASQSATQQAVSNSPSPPAEKAAPAANPRPQAQSMPAAPAEQSRSVSDSEAPDDAAPHATSIDSSGGKSKTKITLFPRRKQGDAKPRHGDSLGCKQLCLEKSTIEDLFHLPIEDAAERLDVSKTTLKKVCRSFGIDKWPYVRVKKVEKSQDQITLSDATKSLKTAGLPLMLEDSFGGIANQASAMEGGGAGWNEQREIQPGDQALAMMFANAQQGNAAAHQQHPHIPQQATVFAMPQMAQQPSAFTLPHSFQQQQQPFGVQNALQHSAASALFGAAAAAQMQSVPQLMQQWLSMQQLPQHPPQQPAAHAQPAANPSAAAANSLQQQSLQMAATPNPATTTPLQPPLQLQSPTVSQLPSALLHPGGSAPPSTAAAPGAEGSGQGGNAMSIWTYNSEPTAGQADSKAITLFPRKKAGEAPKDKRKEPRDRKELRLEKATVEQLFHLTIAEAAARLDVSKTTLKKVCRSFGIDKWPCLKPLPDNSNKQPAPQTQQSAALENPASADAAQTHMQAAAAGLQVPIAVRAGHASALFGAHAHALAGQPGLDASTATQSLSYEQRETLGAADWLARGSHTQQTATGAQPSVAGVGDGAGQLAFAALGGHGWQACGTGERTLGLGLGVPHSGFAQLHQAAGLAPAGLCFIQGLGLSHGPAQRDA